VDSNVCAIYKFLKHRRAPADMRKARTVLFSELRNNRPCTARRFIDYALVLPPEDSYRTGIIGH
jgi:hypothetical protein